MNSSRIAISLAIAGAALVCSTARAQVAVVMAPSASALTKEQVANLYLGRSAELHLLDLPEATQPATPSTRKPPSAIPRR